MRHHGWQRPLHPLQIVGMSIYSFLVVTFYCFLGLFVGNRIAEISVTTIFSCLAVSVMFLFVRCTAIDPTDKTRFKRMKKRANSSKINYGFILGQLVVRFFRRMERKILRSFIRRKYLDPWKTSAQMEPLLPFPLVMKDDAIAPDLKQDDISFCSLCDIEGMRTYDYILAMKEENQSTELEEEFEDSDISSDESMFSESPEKPSFISRFICREGRMNEKPQRLSIKIDKEPEPPTWSKKQGFRASIDPWKLIKMSREKALIAAEKAREKLMMKQTATEVEYHQDSLKPLPSETKNGLLMNPEKNITSISSPRRRFSISPSVIPSPKQRYRSNFDLKLTAVSRELDTYISRQVLCSVLKKDGTEESPR